MINTMRKCILFVVSIWLIQLTILAQSRVIEISPEQGKDNENLMLALEKAAGYKGKPVTVRLSPGIYELDRSKSTQVLYHISNTTSESEDPDPTKHIGLYLHSLKNITIDGCGSTLQMNGEMTSFVLDRCEGIILKNLNIDYKHPTQTEVEVLEEGKDYLIVQVHPTSQYRIVDEQLEWYGDGWSFKNGIAQLYDRASNMTWRSWSPMENLIRAVELRPNVLYLQYKEKTQVGLHIVFQMRDSFRDEVSGFVNRSKNVQLENLNFYYLGNFGVVCQYSENVTFDRCNFAPRPDSGRTNAGFADFIQVSGCRGMIDIRNSRFSGAHDDPINIHGTHLRVMEFLSPNRLKVRFMHDQTFGFEAFFKGDDIELVDPLSLLAVEKAKVKEAKLVTPREMELTLSGPLSPEVIQRKDLVVENVLWTPEVRITNNYFERIPTRGILITTRRKSLIEGNTFYGMQMSGILVADDGLSWYESGPVHDLTIRRNTFFNCGEPVINIDPENREYKGAVHKNITIEENYFYMRKNSSSVIRAKAVDGLVIRHNLIYTSDAEKNKESDFIQTRDCNEVSVEKNRIQHHTCD
jgi:alpha-1,3-galactosidase A